MHMTALAIVVLDVLINNKNYNSAAAATTTTKPSLQKAPKRASLVLSSQQMKTPLAKAPRSWAEFFKRPALPIATNYTYRYLTNIVYFSRNYLNIVTAGLLLFAAFHPMFFISLGVALQLHVGGAATATPLVQILLRITQLVFLVALPFFTPHHSVLMIHFVIYVLFMIVIVSVHALVTPYTDEASGLLDSLLGDQIEPPTTPVLSFERVHDSQTYVSPTRRGSATTSSTSFERGESFSSPLSASFDWSLSSFGPLSTSAMDLTDYIAD
eukprot:PhM_4_TR8807/c0_g1_i1/m.83672